MSDEDIVTEVSKYPAATVILTGGEPSLWYAGLPSSRYHALAQKYLPNGTCGVVSFGVKGGKPAAQKLMQALQLCAIETHVADARTCCLHPASTTHRQMNEQELIAAGISGQRIRMLKWKMVYWQMLLLLSCTFWACPSLPT